MAKLIRDWSELAQVPPNDKYKIVIDEDKCCGWIKPIVEDEKTLDSDFFKTHFYLSTHTFYGGRGQQYKKATKLLKSLGFDIEIDNWDKE